MPTHKKVWALLSPHERRRGLQVLGLVIVMAVMETIGVASVMPFLTVLGDPNALETAPYLQSLYDRFGFQSLESFLLALGVASFVMLLVSSIFRVATTFVLNHYTQMRRHSIGQRLLAVYLRQPYAFFLNRNSGDLV